MNSPSGAACQPADGAPWFPSEQWVGVVLGSLRLVFLRISSGKFIENKRLAKPAAPHPPGHCWVSQSRPLTQEGAAGFAGVGCPPPLPGLWRCPRPFHTADVRRPALGLRGCAQCPPYVAAHHFPLGPGHFPVPRLPSPPALCSGPCWRSCLVRVRERSR